MKTSFEAMDDREPFAQIWVALEIGDGKLKLPAVNRWCLFEMWQRFPMRNADGSVEYIKAYGYIKERDNRKTIVHLPLYKQEVNICKVARWKYVDLPMNAGLEKFSE